MDKLSKLQTLILTMVTAFAAIIFYVPFTVIAFKYGQDAFIIYPIAVFAIWAIAYAIMKKHQKIQRNKKT